MRSLCTQLSKLGLLVFLVLAVIPFGCKKSSESASTGGVTPAEAQDIAKDAYIYGFPLVDSYRIMYAYFVDQHNPEYKGPFNQLRNIPRVYTPEDKAVQTPNSDTPAVSLSLDLIGEVRRRRESRKFCPRKHNWSWRSIGHNYSTPSISIM